MSARDEMIERLASALFETDEVLTSWHHASAEDVTEYRLIAAKEIDAYAAEVRKAALLEAAGVLETKAAGTIMIFEALSRGFRNGLIAGADKLRRMTEEF